MLENFTGYEKKNWKNSPDKTTPLSAENLDYMDSGVKRNADALQEIKNAIADKVENKSDKIPTGKAVTEYVQEMGGGDMTTSVYDPEKTGKVISAMNADNSSEFGGNPPTYYAKADMVTKKYDSNAVYTKGQTCIQSDKIWRAKADINTPEAWTEGHWEETSLEQIRAEMESEISSLNASTDNVAKQYYSNILNTNLERNAVMFALGNDVKKIIIGSTTTPFNWTSDYNVAGSIIGSWLYFFNATTKQEYFLTNTDNISIKGLNASNGERLIFFGIIMNS